MAEQNMRVTLDLSQEQLNTVESLFMHYDWEYKEINRSNINECLKSDNSTQTVPNNGIHEHGSQIEQIECAEFRIDQDVNAEECQYCYCRPCITNEANRQLWWELHDTEPSDRNHGLRKEKYKRFWTMMFHRYAWEDQRYKIKKEAALKNDPRFKKYIWHRRDIMPKCVLQLVRQWLPNTLGTPYMGHLWE